MPRLSKDIWVEQHGHDVRMVNVLTSQSVCLTPQELTSIESGRTAPQTPVSSTETEPADGTLHSVWALDRAVSSLLAQHRRCSIETLQQALPDPLTRLENCESDLLAATDYEKELSRDLRSAFRTAKAFLTDLKVQDREFDFTPGLLGTLWKRPTLDFVYGQLACMPESTQRRVSLASGKANSLILGDDDLMGLAWNKLHSSNCHVFEIDQRILNFYEECDLPQVQCYQRDLTCGLPSEFHESYQAVFTDPMYGKAGMDMFLKCCSQGLSTDAGSTIYLSTRPDLIEEGDRLDHRLEQVGLRVRQKHPNFSRYRFPDQTRRSALKSLNRSGLPRSFLRGLLKVPYYYSDLLEVERIP